MPVLGVNSSQNQTVSEIKQDKPLSNPMALFYAIEATSPGFRENIERIYPELSGYFNYTPLDPRGRDSEVVENAPSDIIDAASVPIPKLLPAEWIIALSSKSFLIVTGSSGTGKTRTARDIARALDYSLPPEVSASITKPANCAAFIPVGANWQDPNTSFRLQKSLWIGDDSQLS